MFLRSVSLKKTCHDEGGYAAVGARHEGVKLISDGRCREPPRPVRGRGYPSFLSPWRPSEDFIESHRSKSKGLVLL